MSAPPILATVLFDFVGTEESELTLKKGEVLKVLAKYDNGWWVGETSLGSTGVFPGTYVKEELPPVEAAPLPPVASTPPQPSPAVSPSPPPASASPAPASASPAPSTASTSAPAARPASGTLPAAQGAYVTAKRDFSPSHPMQLAFKAGDQILLLERFPTGWHKGRLGTQTGLFSEKAVDGMPPADAAPAPSPQAPPPSSSSSSSAPIAAPEAAQPEPASETRGGNSPDVLVDVPVLFSVVSKFAFQAAGPEELSFPEGATIEVIENPPEDPNGWWKGIYQGAIGHFPGSFVERAKLPTTQAWPEKPIAECLALYDFEGDVTENELSFQVGDVLFLFEDLAEGWCRGSCRGIVGHFPASYVEKRPLSQEAAAPSVAVDNKNSHNQNEQAEQQKQQQKQQQQEAEAEAERQKLVKQQQEEEAERLRRQEEAEAEALKCLQEAEALHQRQQLEKQQKDAEEAERLRQEHEAERLRIQQQEQEAAEAEKLLIQQQQQEAAERLRQQQEHDDEVKRADQALLEAQRSLEEEEQRLSLERQSSKPAPSHSASVQSGVSLEDYNQLVGQLGDLRAELSRFMSKSNESNASLQRQLDASQQEIAQLKSSLAATQESLANAQKSTDTPAPSASASGEALDAIQLRLAALENKSTADFDAARISALESSVAKLQTTPHPAPSPPSSSTATTPSAAPARSLPPRPVSQHPARGQTRGAPGAMRPVPPRPAGSGESMSHEEMAAKIKSMSEQLFDLHSQITTQNTTIKRLQDQIRNETSELSKNPVFSRMQQKLTPE